MGATACTATMFCISEFYKTREIHDKLDIKTDAFNRRNGIWKQEFVNGGAHTEQAVQDDAEKKEPRGGPYKGCVRKISDDVCAHYCEEYVHNGQTTKTDGMGALTGNAKGIAVLA